MSNIAAVAATATPCDCLRCSCCHCYPLLPLLPLLLPPPLLLSLLPLAATATPAAASAAPAVTAAPAATSTSAQHAELAVWQSIGLIVAIFVSDVAFTDKRLQGDAKLGALLSAMMAFVCIGISKFHNFQDEDVNQQVPAHAQLRSRARTRHPSV